MAGLNRKPFHRKPFQGVVNIIRFNWHFYVIAVVLLCGLFIVRSFLPVQFHIIIYSVIFLAGTGTLISLAVSYYIYDYSGIYALNFLNGLRINSTSRLVNIHAGFDETSEILKTKFPESLLTVFDFYDPAKHTEVSIKRARKAYPPYPGTVSIETTNLPLEKNSVDFIFLIFAAHEIRENNERAGFFKQLQSALKPSGRIIVTEHRRDFYNFLAFNFGFFHFLPESVWINTFKNAGLEIESASKFTPFVKNYVLRKNGTAS